MDEWVDVGAATDSIIAPPLLQATRIQKKDTRLIERRKMLYPVTEIRVAIYNTKCSVLARYLDKRGQEFKSTPQLVAIQFFRRQHMVVGNHPTNFVNVAIAPEKSSNLPDITVRSAMRAGAQIAAPLQGKRDDIVGEIVHSDPLAY